MINILFPAGCYGTYLAATLAGATNLTDFELTSLDNAGSSHGIRSHIQELSDTLRWGHLKTFSNTGHIIVIDPLMDHSLDYADNQLDKQFERNILLYRI